MLCCECRVDGWCARQEDHRAVAAPPVEGVRVRPLEQVECGQRPREDPVHVLLGAPREALAVFHLRDGAPAGVVSARGDEAREHLGAGVAGGGGSADAADAASGAAGGGGGGAVSVSACCATNGTGGACFPARHARAGGLRERGAAQLAADELDDPGVGGERLRRLRCCEGKEEEDASVRLHTPRSERTQ